MWTEIVLIVFGLVCMITLKIFEHVGKFKVFILVLGLICISIGSSLMIIEKLSEKKSALTGELDHSKKESVESYDIKLIYGNNTLNLSNRDLKEGRAIKPFNTLFGFDYPFSIKLLNGQISVSAKIRTLDNKVISEIKNNEWEINHQNYFKRNYDNSAIEVIDSNGYPYLQLELINSNTIRIGGIFFDSKKDQVLIITQKTVVIFGSKKFEDIGIHEIMKMYTIKELFEYPSDRHFGKRNEI